MKLCRFELIEEPGHARSGLYHNGRVYETDGAEAVGVHDLPRVRMLAPVAQPPSARFFSVHEGCPCYTYRNPLAAGGPITELPVPAWVQDLDVELRIAAVIAVPGLRIDPDEAAGHLLGLTQVLALVARDAEREERARGEAPWRSVDLPIALGPFIATIEDLRADETLRFRWRWALRADGDLVDESESTDELGVAEMLALASESRPVLPGELLAGPPLPLRPLVVTPLGRSLLPGDQLQSTVEGIGSLVVQLTEAGRRDER